MILAGGFTGAGFHRLTLWIALAFMALGLGFRMGPWVTTLPPLTTAAAALYGVAFLAAVVFSARYDADEQNRRFLWIDIAAAAGVVAIVSDPVLHAFSLGNALFVAMRLFLGVLAPLGLTWMTWKTVEIRSIQSATGILYAAVVFVLFGEVISAYLSLATGQPY